MRKDSSGLKPKLMGFNSSEFRSSGSFTAIPESLRRRRGRTSRTVARGTRFGSDLFAYVSDFTFAHPEIGCQRKTPSRYSRQRSWGSMTIHPHLGLDRAGSGTDGNDDIFPSVRDAARVPRWVTRPLAWGTSRLPVPDGEGPTGSALPR